MNKVRLAVVAGIFTLVFMILSDGARAASMRCGSDLIVDGRNTTKYKVLKTCGQPNFKDAPTESGRSYNVWFYQKGDFVYRIQFNGLGVVESITYSR